MVAHVLPSPAPPTPGIAVLISSFTKENTTLRSFTSKMNIYNASSNSVGKLWRKMLWNWQALKWRYVIKHRFQSSSNKDWFYYYCQFNSVLNHSYYLFSKWNITVQLMTRRKFQYWPWGFISSFPFSSNLSKKAIFYSNYSNYHVYKKKPQQTIDILEVTDKYSCLP